MHPSIYRARSPCLLGVLFIIALCGAPPEGNAHLKKVLGFFFRGVDKPRACGLVLYGETDLEAREERVRVCGATDGNLRVKVC